MKIFVTLLNGKKPNFVVCDGNALHFRKEENFFYITNKKNEELYRITFDSKVVSHKAKFI